MTRDCSLEPMTLEDLDEVVRIENSVFSSPWSRRSFVAELGKEYSRPLVARQEGRVVGYAVLWLIDDKGHLANLAVDEEVRRRGIGSFLLEAVLAHAYAAGCGSIWLEVRASNTSAQSLYRKYGFTLVGVRRNYYSDHEDALVMCKVLGGLVTGTNK
ncbi:MAG: ribosomal protein S18-alanine N-acetyltransferase [candidate division WOR-3 bacterium]